MDTLLTFSRRRLLGAGATLGALAVLGGCGSPRTPAQRLGGATMGSTWTATVAGAERSAAELQHLQAQVQAALDGVDARMSLYRPDSELVRFNRAPASQPVALSPELLQVLQAGQQVAQWTAGAFDMTVAPLVLAWGFGPGAQPGTVATPGLPAAHHLQAGRRLLGHQGLQLDAATGSARKAWDGLQLDLGGIAKGYGVDQAAQALQSSGVRHFMLEVGGEVRTAGLNPQGRPWQIGIEEPDVLPRRARSVLPLSGGAMATSGDYRNYFEQDGRRYSHEIDPRSGEPVHNPVASVTVVAGDALHADALATGLMVLGLDSGLALAQQRGLAAHFIVRSAGGALAEHSSSAWLALQRGAA